MTIRIDANGDAYEIEKWTDDSREEGRLVWHEGEPELDEWDSVRMITANYDPEGEGDYRNLAVSPDRPLDPPVWSDYFDRYGVSPDEYQSPYGPELYTPDDLIADWRIISP